MNFRLMTTAALTFACTAITLALPDSAQASLYYKANIPIQLREASPYGIRLVGKTVLTVVRSYDGEFCEVIFKGARYECVMPGEDYEEHSLDSEIVLTALSSKTIIQEIAGASFAESVSDYDQHPHLVLYPCGWSGGGRPLVDGVRTEVDYGANKSLDFHRAASPGVNYTMMSGYASLSDEMPEKLCFKPWVTIE